VSAGVHVHQLAAMFDPLRSWARTIQRDVLAIWIAARDPRVPWYAKLLAVAVAGYALSPIDLIPDFIPVFGFLDDLLIIPLGILLVVRLIRPALMREFRASAALHLERPTSRAAAVVIVLLWTAAIGFVVWWLQGRIAW
jgi:uncharacterized membrane protein YkvA (DUF1232 family)